MKRYPKGADWYAKRGVDPDTISPRQEELLAFIRAYWQECSYGPSVRDCAHGLDVTVQAIFDMLANLERKGAITRAPGKARTLRATQ